MPTMATKRDYYEVLEVDRNASERDIASAYRQLAIKYHPDSNPNDEQATERFKEGAEAYEVLSDAEKRARYDQFGHAGLTGSSGGTGFRDVEDIFDAFGDLFGGAFGDFFGGGGRRRTRRRRGANLKTEVTLDLEEAARGVSKEVSFRRNKPCAICQGTGAKPGSNAKACPHCGGRGQVVQSAGILRVQTTCPTCQGSGRVISERCAECRGNGFESESMSLSIAIPAGVDDGMQVRLPGEGEPGPPGGEPGDCYCFIHVRPHSLFEREENHLYLEMPISYTQAALGARIEVPSLEGRHELTIPPGTDSGHVFRIRGHGVPDPRGGSQGDLFVRTFVEVPKKLDNTEEALLRNLAELEDKNVAPHRRSFLDRIRDYFSANEVESRQTSWSEREE